MCRRFESCRGRTESGLDQGIRGVGGGGRLKPLAVIDSYFSACLGRLREGREVSRDANVPAMSPKWVVEAYWGHTPHNGSAPARLTFYM